MGENFAEKDFARMDEVLSELGDKKGTLIPILQKAQDIFGYLPKEVLIYISRKTGVPISQVFGVVTFYAQFHLKPRGRNIVRSCQGTACHVRGAKKILQELANCLNLEGDVTTTPDLRYTLETVACIGCCGLAPVIMVNDDTHGRLTPDKIEGILDQYQ
ncbi:MAG: NAD(P)H-dependent oxidoreductase subunit E [Synergistaceae bacterium]|jgi:NADH-quinone oxidoreductase subunit E|nr:NAD(P)H-dependent oxidoreductase subunit E [Synergistaceae bacterium]